jgi:hypothetical protein
MARGIVGLRGLAVNMLASIIGSEELGSPGGRVGRSGCLVRAVLHRDLDDIVYTRRLK